MDVIEPAPDQASSGAFAEILRLHQGRVRAYLRRFVFDGDLADDLAQETFLAAYRSLPSRNPAAPVDLWLLGIARNRALAHLRDEARRRSLESRPLRAALAAWSARRLETAGPDLEGEIAALRECLSKLPDPGAALISEYYGARKTSAEIARRTGRKESAVRMTLLRLREALKQCVRIRIARAGSGA
jgi:RNA polymerase sigma-70 factor (ECF subfamily)